VRYGDQVEKDMIAVRLTPDVPMLIVGSPGYFEWHTVPTSPQELMKHKCITLRLVSSRAIYKSLDDSRHVPQQFVERDRVVAHAQPVAL
jgi:hypothetical protein